MDVVLFFKAGEFYELYEIDAKIGHKEFDWKMTVSGVGKCRQVTHHPIFILVLAFLYICPFKAVV